MATKNPIQEEPTQNISAPRVEPAAANLIIPRRDLLTGAALLLVGSASGCANSGKTSGGGSCPPPSLRTKFMNDFTAKFIGNPANILPPDQPDNWPDQNPGSSVSGSRIWPTPPDRSQAPADIVTDFETFVHLLMTVGFVQQLPVPPPTTPLGTNIMSFLKAEGWPSAPPVWVQGDPTPDLFGPYTRPLLEISVILDRLLQAINSYETPPQPPPHVGPPTNLKYGGQWPPH